MKNGKIIHNRILICEMLGSFSIISSIPFSSISAISDNVNKNTKSENDLTSIATLPLKFSFSLLPIKLSHFSNLVKWLFFLFTIILLKESENKMEGLKVKKGDIFWAELNETGRHIQAGRRPVLILGNAKSTRFSDIVTIVPISGRVEKADTIPTHIRLNTALKCESILLPEQIRTISKDQLLGKCIYNLTEDEQEKVDQAISKQLGIA